MSLTDPEAIDLLAAMLRASSPCGEEDRVAGVILGAMSSAGFDVRRDEAGNAIGTIGNAGRTLMFLGHMDTAPGVVTVEQRQGKLFGRGAVDAKGPLAAAIVAASRADASVKLVIVGAVQEEGPSAGARHLAKTDPPDLLIIGEPSNWDAVTLGYKGNQRFNIIFSRNSAHTASPEDTAPERAVAFWQRLSDWCREQTSHAQREFDRLTPTLIGMDSHDDGLCTTAALHVGLRLPPSIDLTTACEGVWALVGDEPGVEIHFAPGEAAVRVERRGPLVSAFLRGIRAEGGEPRFKVKTGTSDWNLVAEHWRCPAVAYGPGDSRLDHTPDEHIVLDEYLRGIRVLARVFEGV